MWLFVYLIQSSGVSWAVLDRVGWQGLLLLLAISGAVIVLDTLAMMYALRNIVRPRFSVQLGLRLAGDSLSNGAPGGVVLGETFKAVALRRAYGVPLAKSAGALLLIKFGLGISQSIFILLGLAFAYPHLASRSTAVFGFEGAHLIALGATVLMGLALLAVLWMIARGGSVGWMARRAATLPIPRLRRWLAERSERFVALDETLASVIAEHRHYLPHVFAFLLLGWLVGVGETWVLLRTMGADAGLGEALAIESVGSLFRLIFFMVPSGIGGQDASFFALFRVYSLPDALVGPFVILKRVKELIWIGVGLILLAVFRSRVPAQEAEP